MIPFHLQYYLGRSVDFGLYLFVGKSAADSSLTKVAKHWQAKGMPLGMFELSRLINRSFGIDDFTNGGRCPLFFFESHEHTSVHNLQHNVRELDICEGIRLELDPDETEERTTMGD